MPQGVSFCFLRKYPAAEGRPKKNEKKPEKILESMLAFEAFFCYNKVVLNIRYNYNDRWRNLHE